MLKDKTFVFKDQDNEKCPGLSTCPGIATFTSHIRGHFARMKSHAPSSRPARVSRTPKTAVKRIQKLHLKVVERFRQVSPSAFATRSSACSLFVCDRREKTEVIERGTARNRYEAGGRTKMAGRDGKRRGGRGGGTWSPSNRCKNAGNRRKS